MISTSIFIILFNLLTIASLLFYSIIFLKCFTQGYDSEELEEDEDRPRKVRKRNNVADFFLQEAEVEDDPDEDEDDDDEVSSVPYMESFYALVQFFNSSFEWAELVLHHLKYLSDLFFEIWFFEKLRQIMRIFVLRQI